jgi:C7-C12 aromatase (ARO/CYC)
VLTSKTHTVEQQVLVAVPLPVVRELVEDVVGWTQLYSPAVHAEYVERNGDDDLIQHWSVVDEHTVRTWRVRRWSHPDGDRISFVHEPAKPPMRDIRGDWTFVSEAGGSATLVRMRHEFELIEEAADRAAELAAAIQRNSNEYLAALKYAAQRRAELAQLILSFEDSLFIAGSIKDAYDYIYQANKWPERIPQVSRLVLEENKPNIQFFDMDTVTPDGATHTMRSVRICLPPNKIVYKQIHPPTLLDAHTGHWLFTEVPEGVIASARRTVTIKPSALSALGAGTTVRDARNYLRRVLSADSMANLHLVKSYAEDRAGI